MTEAWKEWEGQVVCGKFHLRQYLGGGENSAVFLTQNGEREPQKAAIKLLVTPPEESELQLSLWGLAAKLSHPHLIRLFDMGRCQFGEIELLYLVMEYAEENLAQIVPRRPLTQAETRDMLEPVLDALEYVHGQGFVHGHIKPANIMGVEDQLKISSDGLYRIGESRVGLGKPSVYDAPEMASATISPAADVWSLGMTLVEGLTQCLPGRESEHGELMLPETVPVEFLELTGHCLCRDLQHRWTVADIASHLRRTSFSLQSGTASSPRPATPKWRYVAPLVVVGVLLAAMLLVPRLFNNRRNAERTTSSVAEQPGVQSEPAHKPLPPEAGNAKAKSPTPKAGRVPGKVIHQVVPDVPRQARNTIRGTVRVGVRVRVDPSGKVAGAKLESPGPSRYFTQLALKAARRWKFRPAEVDARNVPSEWILRFQFEKVGASAVSVQVAP